MQDVSPCIDAGKDVSPVVVMDLEGKERGHSFDIGAFEYSEDVNQDDGNNNDDDNDNDDNDDESCFIQSIF